MTTIEQCPCGSLKAYEDCCAPLHQGDKKAKTAEQLMRSRFSAFSKAHVDYLIATLHPSKRSVTDRNSIQSAVTNCQWLKLSIIDISNSSLDNSESFVEFLAYYEEKGYRVLQERSRFIRENGIWFYVDGETKKPTLPGRNELCWCGSGKKVKKCHAIVNNPTAMSGRS